MSTTTTTSLNVQPTATDTAVAVSKTGMDLFNQAEANPVVKADLQSLFDSYSHSPIIAGLVPVVAGLLAQKQITVGNQLLTIGIGVAVTAIGYAWQWASMKINKPPSR